MYSRSLAQRELPGFIPWWAVRFENAMVGSDCLLSLLLVTHFELALSESTQLHMTDGCVGYYLLVPEHNTSKIILSHCSRVHTIYYVLLNWKYVG
jgi:hypothetical protein